MTSIAMFETYASAAGFIEKFLQRAPFLLLFFAVFHASAAPKPADTLRHAGEAHHILIGAAAASAHLPNRNTRLFSGRSSANCKPRTK